jgi:hypothetical protein
MWHCTKSASIIKTFRFTIVQFFYKTWKLFFVEIILCKNFPLSSLIIGNSFGIAKMNLFLKWTPIFWAKPSKVSKNHKNSLCAFFYFCSNHHLKNYGPAATPKLNVIKSVLVKLFSIKLPILYMFVAF